MLRGAIELYIQFQSTCVYYVNLSDPLKKPPRDEQLFSGFLNAENYFLDELKLGVGANFISVTRGNAEMRLFIDDPKSASLILQDISGLDELAYSLLDDLTKTIMQQFQSAYIDEIKTFLDSGKFTFKGIKEFVSSEIQKMKAYIFTSYLLKILGTLINQKVLVATAKEWMESLNDFYRNSENKADLNTRNDEVRNKMEEKMKVRKTLRKIIPDVNKKYMKTWTLFEVPIIEVPVFDD